MTIHYIDATTLDDAFLTRIVSKIESDALPLDYMLKYADLLDALTAAAMPEPERSMTIAQEELDA